MAYQAKETRYDVMPYAHCGRSGLRLPKVSLGLWHNFGGQDDRQNMKDMLFCAFDHGITHFDLANNYGPKRGDAERNFGEILKTELAPYRDEMIISTKAGYEMWPGPYGDRGSRKNLLASLNQSLERLQLPYVDIFYHHCMDADTPLEETMGALASAVQSGKALYVGLSNYDGEHLKQAAAILNDLHCLFVINQNRYSILDRTVEQNGLLEQVKATGTGLITFSPLAQGLLTNRYLHGIPQDSRVKTGPGFLTEKHLKPELLEKIRKLDALAQNRGQSLAQMALAWILKDDAVTSVLVGASCKEQILDNIGVLNAPAFTADELREIDRIVF